MTMVTSNAGIPAAPEWTCLPAVCMFADVNDFGRINLRDLGGLTPRKNIVTGLHNSGNCYWDEVKGRITHIECLTITE